MACACKTKQKKYKNANGKIEKRSFKYYINFISMTILSRIFMPLFIFSLCLFLMPLIVMILIITQIFFGEAKMIMPRKFMNVFNNIKKNGE